MKATPPRLTAAGLEKVVGRLRQTVEFDAEWYTATYPDVAASGFDPAVHFILIGGPLGRDPGPFFSTRLWQDLRTRQPKPGTPAVLDYLDQRKRGVRLASPRPDDILFTAAHLGRQGDHAGAIALAEKHLPAHLAYTSLILRANAALAERQDQRWLAHLNGYLAHFGLAPVILQGKGQLFDRLATAPLPAAPTGPLVSVLMPAWNAEATIEMSARSILKQTWRRLELIIVDDASTDGTFAAMQRIASSDARVRVLRNPVNAGPYVAKNIALHHAAGSWITGHDADDWAHPQRLEHHMSAVLARDGALKVSVTQAIRLDAQGKFTFFDRFGVASPDGVSRRFPITCLFDASFMRQNLGHWDSVRFAADSEMIGRAMTLLDDGFAMLDQPSVLSLDSPTSITNDTAHGVDKVAGLSPVRQTYRDAWQRWHAQFSRTADAYLPLKQHSRRFAAPRKMQTGIVPETLTLLPDQASLEPQPSESRDRIGSSGLPRRVILHVRMAGDAAVQTAFSNYRKDLLGQGVHVARANPSAWADLVEECAACESSIHTLLLSVNLEVDDGEIIALAARLAGSDVEILVLLPEPMGWALSRCAHAITDGTFCDARPVDVFIRDLLRTGALDFAARLDRMIARFKATRVHAMNHDRLCAEGRMMDAVASRIGVRLAKIVPDPAPSLGVDALEALRRLNPLIARLPDATREMHKKAIIADMESGGGQIGLSPYMHELLASEAERSSELLSRRYLRGIGEDDRPFLQVSNAQALAMPNETVVLRHFRKGLDHLSAVDPEGPSSHNRLCLFDACAPARVILCDGVEGADMEIIAALRDTLVFCTADTKKSAYQAQTRIDALYPAASVVVRPVGSVTDFSALWNDSAFRHPDLVVIGGDTVDVRLAALKARLTDPLRVLILTKGQGHVAVTKLAPD